MKEKKYIKLHDIGDWGEVYKFRLEDIDSIEPLAHGTRVYTYTEAGEYDVAEDYYIVDSMLCEAEEEDNRTYREYLFDEFAKLPRLENGFIEADAWYEYRQMLLKFVDTAEPIEPEADDSPAFCRLLNGEKLTVYNPRQLVASAYLV